MLLVSQLLVAFLATSVCAKFDNTLPSYHYGAPIKVECMNRSSYAPLGPFPFVLHDLLAWETEPVVLA